MSDSFFTTTDNKNFKPSHHCRGPWHAEQCHAGPPAGLLARAAERELPHQQLVRLTMNLLRPIPFAGFSVNASITKKGRMVSLVSCSIRDGQARQCVLAEALLITAQEPAEFATANIEVPLPGDAIAGDFPISQLHELACFAGDGVETRYPPGQSPSTGPTTAWIRTIALLPDEAPSPFQRMCPMADCGNAFGRNAEPSEVNFANPDLTIAMYREPQGEWMGSQSVGHWAGNGIGISDATLIDEQGIVGRAVQTLLLRRT